MDKIDSVCELVLELGQLILLDGVHDTWISWERVTKLLGRRLGL